MFRLPLILLMAALLSGAAFSFETPPKARPELNAFLNRPVKTVPQLLNQVKGDSEVADRYMRHFRMTKEELLAYFKTLRYDRLKLDMEVAQYSVPQGGRLKMHRSLLKKGEPVFVDPQGHPILRVKCGNPLGLGPQPEPKMSFVSDMTPPVPMKVELLTTEIESIEETYAFEPTVPMLEEPLMNPPLLQPEEPVVTTQGPQPLDPTHTPGVPIWPVVGSAIVDVAMLFDREPDGVVPEPASIAVLSLGLIALCRKRKRR